MYSIVPVVHVYPDQSYKMYYREKMYVFLFNKDVFGFVFFFLIDLVLYLSIYEPVYCTCFCSSESTRDSCRTTTLLYRFMLYLYLSGSRVKYVCVCYIFYTYPGTCTTSTTHDMQDAAQCAHYILCVHTYSGGTGAPGEHSWVVHVYMINVHVYIHECMYTVYIMYLYVVKLSVE